MPNRYFSEVNPEKQMSKGGNMGPGNADGRLKGSEYDTVGKDGAGADFKNTDNPNEGVKKLGRVEGAED